MNNNTIFTKTARGLGEALGKTRQLSREQRKILKEIDGKRSFAELHEQLGMDGRKLRSAIENMLDGDYIREFGMATASGAAVKATPSMGDTEFGLTMPATLEAANSQLTIGDFFRAMEQPVEEEAAAGGSLDFKNIAQADAPAAKSARPEGAQTEEERRAIEEEARRITALAQKRIAEQARKEAEDKARFREQQEAKQRAEEEARRKAEEEARKKAEEEARRAAQEKARREAEEAVRRAAEEAARKKAEEKARQEAEAKARAEAERQAKLRAEEEARRKAEEKARREAEEAARRKAEEEARRKAEEDARRAAEEKARREAEEAARRQAEEKARQEAEAKARAEAERQAKLRAEEKARRKAEEEARRQAEEAERRRAEEEAARLEAERQAKLRAEEEARRQAEERARQEAMEQARQRAHEAARRAAEELAQREAEEQQRAEAERQAKLRAEEEARRKAEEDAHRAAEEKARREAEEAARREAEEAARVLAAEKARKKEEEKARKQAEAEARQAAREQARREAAEKARVEAEQKAQRAAEAKARKEAERLAKQEEKERLRREAELAARLKAEEAERIAAEKAEAAAIEAEAKAAEAKAAEARTQAEGGAAPAADAVAHPDPQQQTHGPLQEPSEYAPSPRWRLPHGWQADVKWALRLGVAALVVLAIAAVALVHVFPFNERLARLQRDASEQFGQPVRIGSMNLSLFPSPQWRLGQIVVGEGKQITIERINARVGFGALFADSMQFSELEVVSPVISDEGMGWLLFGKGGAAWSQAPVRASGVRWRSQHVVVPAFSADIEPGDSGWRKAVLSASGGKARVELQRVDGAWRFEMTAGDLVLPFGGADALDALNASGTLEPDGATINQFTAVVLDGTLSGAARLQWDGGWRLYGEAQARQVDPMRITPALLQQGVMHAQFRFTMQAEKAEDLFAAPQARGSFTIKEGVLQGIDMAAQVIGQAGSGKTTFADLGGDFVYTADKVQLSRVRLVAGLLSASGEATADSGGKLAGRFSMDLRTESRQASSKVILGGTLTAPQFQP